MNTINGQVDNEDVFFETLDALPSPILVADSDTRFIVWLNPAAVRLTGYSKEQLIGQNQQMLHPPQPEKSLADVFLQQQTQLASQQKAPTLHEILIHADGSHIPVEITANRIKVNNRTLQIGVFTPLQNILKMQQQLDIKRLQLQSIFDNSQIGIMILDDQRIIRQVNQRLIEILGYNSPQEFIGQSVEILHTSKESFANFGAKYFEKLVQQKALYIEHEARKKDGSTVWCRVSGNSHAFETSAGQLNGAVWVIDDISDIKKIQTELLMERNLFTDGPTTILQWLPQEGWPVLYVSKNIINTLGYTPEEFMAPEFLFQSIIHPQDIEKTKKQAAQNFASKLTYFQQYYRIHNKSGEYRHFYDYTQVQYDKTGMPKKIYGYLIDMTDYLKAQEMSKLLLTHSMEGIFGIDANGITTFVNPAAAKMLGYREEEILNKDNHHLFHHSKANGNQLNAKDCRMSMPLKTGLDYYVSDEVLWRKDGTHFHVEYWSTPIIQEGTITGTVVTFHDISERVNQEQKMHHLAYHDPLTNLPNRRQLLNQLHQVLLQTTPTQNASLMILDIDHFKEVNDTLGHPVGDKLLESITARVKLLLNDNDTFARIGGDEFAILITNDVGSLHMMQVADQIIQTFKEPFVINNKTIQSNTSIGISLCQPDLTVEQIISQADMALYEAKNSGRGTFVFYELNMIDKINNDLKLFNGLTKALHNQEFSLHYQLQFDAMTRKPFGVEMLMRWHPFDNELVQFNSPDVFIQMAEKRGLLQNIALWQLDILIQDIQQLKQAGLQGRIAINISGCQLANIAKMRDFIQKIQLNGINLRDIEFEITETTYAKLTESMKTLLNNLQNQGLSIAIDDFGTGFSSLVALRELESNILKIDKQFIDELETNQDDRAIVSATVVMAHALGKKVVAEGVETAYQAQYLESLQCDYLQGYHLAMPQPIEAVCDYLKRLNKAY